jgi:twitching motility protein PilT
MVNAFPGNRVQEARIRIATTLRAVVCQMLLPVATDGSSIGVVAELMINDAAVAALIREGNTHQLRSHLETGSRIGMQTFDQALAEAVTDGWLDPGLARAKCRDPRSFTAHLTRASA